MKNLFVALIATFIYCAESQAQNALKEPTVNIDVYVKNQVFPEGSTNKMSFRLGRASRSCFRFGVCEIIIFGWTIYNKGTVNLTIESPLSNPFTIIELSKELDGTKFDTNFYVDEAIKTKDGKITVVKGIYKLNKSIGKFGGYKVPLVIN